MNKKFSKLSGFDIDGKMRLNPISNHIEALIPTPCASNHAPDLLPLPNGDVLAVWFAGSAEGNYDISIWSSRLNNGAKTWSEPIKITDDSSKSEQNPSLFLNPNGEIWLIYTAQQAREHCKTKNFNLQYTSEIRRKISKDGGRTWGKSQTFVDEKGAFCRQSIVILSNGRWIFSNWICFNDDTRNGSDITIMRISDDKGKSWRSVEVPNSQGCVHANIIQLESGELVALFRSRKADHIYISRSDNYGDTWSKPQPTELPNNNSSISALLLSAGRIAVVYNPISFANGSGDTLWPFERCPIAIAVSADKGITWPWKRYVEMGDGFFGEKNISSNYRYEYPCMHQDKSGYLHIGYAYRTRKCIKYLRLPPNWIYGVKQGR